MYMQANVNAENVLNLVVSNFGDEKVSTCDAGVIKACVNSLANGDVLTLSIALQWADVQVKRSGTGLLLLFIPKPDFGKYSEKLIDAINSIKGNEDEHKTLNKYAGTIRYYFETCLSDSERQNAFNNTPKHKWDEPALDAVQALTIGFDWKVSPQGFEYWSNIALRLNN